MLTRLFQRAGAMGAASVALFVSILAIGSAQASTAPQVNVYGVDSVTNADGHFEARYHFQRRFAANDPNYGTAAGYQGGKVDYISKKIKVKKRGNPLKWFKKNPLEYAAWAAAAGAGYLIDDLTSQVMNPVERPVGVVGDHYQPGYEWCHELNRCAPTPLAAAYDRYPYYEPGVDPGGRNHSNSVTAAENGGYHVSVYYERLTPSGLPAYYSKQLTVYRQPTSTPLPTETVYEPLQDADAWDFLNPIANDAPAHHLEPWAKDANGNPYIYPEVQAEQAKIVESVPGAEPLPDAVVVNDPLAGRGLGPDGQPLENPSPTPEAPPSEQAPTEFPNDYARENTLQQAKDAAVEIKDHLKEEFEQEPDIAEENPADEIYQPLTDEFDNLPDLPSLLNPPDFDLKPSSSCQTITFRYQGAAVVFPDSNQCSKLKEAQEILGWFIYVCTFFGCVYTILGAQRLRP